MIFLRTLTDILTFLCFFTTPILVLFIIQWFLPLRKRLWVKPVLYISCSLFVGMIIYIGDLTNLPTTLIFFGFTIFLCCEGTRLMRFSLTLILANLGLSYNALIDNLYFPPSNILRFVLWITVFLLLYKLAPKQEYNLPVRLWLLIDLLTLAPFSATLITVLLGNMDFSRGDIQSILLLPTVTISSFGLLLAVMVLARQQKLEQENSYYQLSQLYYQNLEQEQLRIRHLRHDMANHLQLMSSLPEEELRSYLSQLIASPALEQPLAYCDNHMINIILRAKQPQLSAGHIRLDTVISLPEKLPIRDIDLCTIFFNALDNAIEACEQLSAENRIIIIRAAAEKGLFVLQMENPVYDALQYKHNRTLSAKRNNIVSQTKQSFANKLEHGQGLSSIRDVVLHYQGSVEVKAEEHIFRLLICIPIP